MPCEITRARREVARVRSKTVASSGKPGRRLGEIANRAARNATSRSNIGDVRAEIARRLRRIATSRSETATTMDRSAHLAP